MREIKFRGLTAKNEWAYGLPSSDAPNSTAYYNDYSQRICLLLESGGYANVPIKNGTLCQFTGLYDKIGKEIYEGDLCNIVADNGAFRGGKTPHLAEVRWDEEDTGFFYATSHDSYPHVKPWFVVSVEVIGNIYEHSSLLDK